MSRVASVCDKEVKVALTPRSGREYDLYHSRQERTLTRSVAKSRLGPPAVHFLPTVIAVIREAPDWSWWEPRLSCQDRTGKRLTSRKLKAVLYPCVRDTDSSRSQRDHSYYQVKENSGVLIKALPKRTGSFHE